MADVQLLSELPVKRRREAARRQIAALAKERAPSRRARRLIEADLLAGYRPLDRPGDDPGAERAS
jgi:hypothetical protein